MGYDTLKYDFYQSFSLKRLLSTYFGELTPHKYSQRRCEIYCLTNNITKFSFRLLKAYGETKHVEYKKGIRQDETNQAA